MGCGVEEQPQCLPPPFPSQGVQQVKDWIVSRLPQGPTLYPKGVVSEQPGVWG